MARKSGDRFKFEDKWLRGVPAAKPRLHPKTGEPVAKVRDEYWDSIVPGLALGVTERGAKSYFVYRRWSKGAAPSRRSIGDAKVLSLADARSQARKWIEEAEKGINPHEVAEAARREKAGRSTFGFVAEAYIKEKLPEKFRAYGDANDIRRLLIPAWGDRPMVEIEHDDVVELIERIKRKRNPRTGLPMVKSAFDALSLANRIWKWAIGRSKRFGVKINPAREVDVKAEIGERESTGRPLADFEVAAYWQAAKALPAPGRDVFQLLFLTASRISEITDARRSWFDAEERTLTVPSKVTKMKHGDNVIPLVPEAFAIVKAIVESITLPKGSNIDPALFPSRSSPGDPYQGWNKLRPKLYAGMREILGAKFKPFTPHDTRHTIKTWLASAGIEPHISEAVLHHTKRGMEAVYNHHKYASERRDALEQWAKHLESIVGEKRKTRSSTKTNEAGVAA